MFIIILAILIIYFIYNNTYQNQIINIKNKILYKYNFDELWVIYINDLSRKPISPTDINIPYIKKISRNTIIEMKDLNELKEILILITDNDNQIKKEIRKLEFEIAKNNKINNQCCMTLKEGFIIYKDNNNKKQIYKYNNDKFYQKKYGIMNICKNKNNFELKEILNKLKSFYNIYILITNIKEPITLEILNNLIVNIE